MPKEKTCIACGETYYVSRKNKMRLYVGPCCRGTPKGVAEVAEAKRKGLPAPTDKPKPKKVKYKKSKTIIPQYVKQF